MRILMLGPHPTVRGPLPKHTPHLVAALRDLGAEVTVAPWGRRRESERWPEKVFGRARDIGGIRRILRDGAFDVMVVKTAHDWSTLGRDIPLLLATRRLCPSAVLQFHGSQAGRISGPGHRAFKLASSWLLELSRAVLVLSSEEQRQWQAFRPSRRVEVVSNPFVPLPPAGAVSAAWWRALPAGSPVVLFVGRLIPQKGIDAVLEGFARLRRTTPSHLLVVGEGPDAPRARRLAAALGVASHVTFTGYLEGQELSAAYHAATVFVLPTRWHEGFPTVITEAMDAGLPIVTTRIRGMADHLRDGVNALFVGPDDVQALADRLERVLADPGLRVRIAQANREKLKEFSPEVVGRRYLDALAAALDGRPTASVAAGRSLRSARLAFGCGSPGGPVPSIDAIQAFWEAHPCDSSTSTASDRHAYFLEVERVRYARQPHVRSVSRVGQFTGRRVLEIGCGLGTDGAQFAGAGARYVGVDLTAAAVRHARENFRLRGLTGAFGHANAEALPFGDRAFDHVYAFGVLHHTVHPAVVVSEIYRVLRPGGTVTAMVYNRASINFVLEIMLLRRLGRALLRPAWAPALAAALLRLPREKLEGHRRSLRANPHPTPGEWLSMNTDGPECPLARVYSAEEATALFAAGEDVSTTVHYLDLGRWPLIGRLLPIRAVDWIGRRWGWHRIITARKPLE